MNKQYKRYKSDCKQNLTTWRLDLGIGGNAVVAGVGVQYRPCIRPA